MKGNIGVAVIGNVLDINTWSNTPYFFFKAGRAAGRFNEPWLLDLNRLSNARKLWNLKQVVLGRGMGGYQYSQSFLEKAEAQIPAPYFSSTVISFNQVFPRANTVINSGGKIYYYIDATLYDLFEDDHYAIRIPSSMKQLALTQEKENYSRAEAIITMGNWVQESLINFYGLPHSKIAQVLPGANIELPSDFKFKPYIPGAGITRDLILGFVGKDWQRKGLPFLLSVRDLLAQRGYRVNVKVMGTCPEELKDREGLIYTGMINKQNQTSEFIDIVSSCDVGCLFSFSEALGISTLEFLRIGVPVTGFFNKGLRDTLLDGASVRFDVNATEKEVADQLEGVIQNNQLEELTARARAHSPRLSWAQTIEKMMRIISY